VKEIPHHLESKASTAGNVKKGARILAVGLFSVEERKSSTLIVRGGRETQV
jgi:hypothetical protein